MKTQLTLIKILSRTRMLTSLMLLVFIPGTLLSNTTSTPDDKMFDAKSAETDKEKVNLNAEKTTTNCDDVLVMEQENSCMFSYDTKGNAIFIKLFKSRIGDYLQYTQIPVKWLRTHQKNLAGDFDVEPSQNEGWDSNIGFDMSAGFLNDKASEIPGQYFALSGHLNRFSIGIILILTA